MISSFAFWLCFPELHKDASQSLPWTAMNSCTIFFCIEAPGLGGTWGLNLGCVLPSKPCTLGQSCIYPKGSLVFVPTKALCGLEVTISGASPNGA